VRALPEDCALTLARLAVLVLIAGSWAAGILFPNLAVAVRGVLPELVCCTLGGGRPFASGATAARGSLADIQLFHWRLVASLSIGAAPFTWLVAFLALVWRRHNWATATGA